MNLHPYASVLCYLPFSCIDTANDAAHIGPTSRSVIRVRQNGWPFRAHLKALEQNANASEMSDEIPLAHSVRRVHRFRAGTVFIERVSQSSIVYGYSPGDSLGDFSVLTRIACFR